MGEVWLSFSPLLPAERSRWAEASTSIKAIVLLMPSLFPFIVLYFFISVLVANITSTIVNTRTSRTTEPPAAWILAHVSLRRRRSSCSTIHEPHSIHNQDKVEPHCIRKKKHSVQSPIPFPCEQNGVAHSIRELCPFYSAPSICELNGMQPCSITGRAHSIRA